MANKIHEIEIQNLFYRTNDSLHAINLHEKVFKTFKNFYFSFYVEILLYYIVLLCTIDALLALFVLFALKPVPVSTSILSILIRIHEFNRITTIKSIKSHVSWNHICICVYRKWWIDSEEKKNTWKKVSKGWPVDRSHGNDKKNLYFHTNDRNNVLVVVST